MILNVPYFYEMRAVPAGKIKPVCYFVKDVHPVEVREITDAALVARLPEKGMFAKPGGDDVYFWEDQWWHAARHNYSGEPATALRLEDVKEGIEKYGRWDSVKLFDRENPYQAKILDAPEDVAIRRLESTTRDDVIASIEARAYRHILIDGKVMVPCSEPVISAYMADKHNSPGRFLYASYTFLGSHEIKSNQTVWRLDRLDQMLESFRSPVRFRGRTLVRKEDDVELDFEPAEILRPDLLTWDRETTLFWNRFDIDNASFKKTDFSEFSASTFELFTFFRDRSRLIEREDEQAIEKIMGLLKPLQDRLVEEELHAHAFQSTMHAYEKYAEAVAERETIDRTLASVSI